MTLDEIEMQIKNAASIAIFAHENPDGDAVGSALAVYILLKELGKNVDVIIPHFPDTYKYLPRWEEALLEGEQGKIYDLAIAVDCGDFARIDDPNDTYSSAKVTINVDHHSSNSMFADFNFVDPVAPACCQIITSICESLGIEINKDVGICLLTGIITDTGGLRYEGVTSETYEFVADILKKGVKVSKVYKQAFAAVSRNKFEIQKLALNRLEFLEDGKVTFTYITKKDMEEYGVDISDLDGIVESGRDIQGVEVSIFLSERDEGFKASLRSNEYVNCADACILFGGGGHIKASGCTLNYSLEEAKEKIVSAVKRQLK